MNMASDSSHPHQPEQYCFEPLRDPSSQIRVLWLKPADSPYDLIDCSLHVQDLEHSQYVTRWAPCMSTITLYFVMGAYVQLHSPYMPSYFSFAATPGN